MKIHSKHFPPDIKELYHIYGIISEYGYVYIQIIKDVYEFIRKSFIYYNQLISHMDPHSYYFVPFTTGLWDNKTRRKTFCLCVDDFGVKYLNRYDADYLLEYLKKNLEISIDWEGRNYFGLTIY